MNQVWRSWGEAARDPQLVLCADPGRWGPRSAGSEGCLVGGTELCWALALAGVCPGPSLQVFQD